MKKISASKIIIVAVFIMGVSVLAWRCTKVGVIANQLDRSINAIPDSTVFSPFYDSTIISTSDVIPDVNDRIIKSGVLGILKRNCATANCHNGSVKGTFNSYSDVMKYVIPNSPEGSKLWQMITTNNLNQAMPPVATNKALSLTDKTTIYNWILYGAKEYPTLVDFRSAAIRIIQNGCGSANCHNQATATGAWARKGLLGPLTTSDTTTFIYTNPVTGAPTLYCQLSNPTLLAKVWGDYKDSVKKFYQDTTAYASYRPYKTFATPISSSSTRGPQSNYDDIVMDIMYPKSVRSTSSVQYTNPSGVKYYSGSNYLNSTSSLIMRIDSTVLFANPYTNVFATSKGGDMAYSDGGLTPSDIAIIKAWFFADPNIPNVWKYGTTGAGIYKYRKTGNIIMKH